jgi:hypothetical protein
MTRVTIVLAFALVCAPAALRAQQAGRGMRGRTPSTVGLHGYSLVLVIGDMQGSGAADTVPSAARKALTDMQAFLPFKHYQLVDAAWMLCCGEPRSATSGKIRGPADRDYFYAIETQGATDDGKLTVRFMLRDDGDLPPAGVTKGERGDVPRDLYQAMKDRDEAETALTQAKQKFTVNHPDLQAARDRANRAQARYVELRAALSRDRDARAESRNVMDNMFTIGIGETVVIGTSRLKGDQALIVLLTAATKSGAPGERR